MSQPIVYVDTSEVRPGRLAELKVAMNDWRGSCRRTSRSCSPTTCTSVTTGPG
jgi:hypothetical protein